MGGLLTNWQAAKRLPKRWVSTQSGPKFGLLRPRLLGQLQVCSLALAKQQVVTLLGHWLRKWYPLGKYPTPQKGSYDIGVSEGELSRKLAEIARVLC